MFQSQVFLVSAFLENNWQKRHTYFHTHYIIQKLLLIEKSVVKKTVDGCWKKSRPAVILVYLEG